MRNRLPRTVDTAYVEPQKAAEQRVDLKAKLATHLSSLDNGNAEKYHAAAQSNQKKWLATASVAPAAPTVQVIGRDFLDVAREMAERTGQTPAVLTNANEKKAGGFYREGNIAVEEIAMQRTDGHQQLERELADGKIDAEANYTSAMQNLVGGRTQVAANHPHDSGYRVQLEKDHPWVCTRGGPPGYEQLLEDQMFEFYNLCSAADDLRIFGANGVVTGYKPFDESSMRQKIAAQLDTMIANGIEHAVLGAFGCGIFGNPPDKVAQLYKEEIEKRPGSFKSISFAIVGGRPPPLPAFQRILSNVQLGQKPPAPELQAAAALQQPLPAAAPVVVTPVAKLEAKIVPPAPTAAPKNPRQNEAAMSFAPVSTEETQKQVEPLLARQGVLVREIQELSNDYNRISSSSINPDDRAQQLALISFQKTHRERALSAVETQLSALQEPVIAKPVAPLRAQQQDIQRQVEAEDAKIYKAEKQHERLNALQEEQEAALITKQQRITEQEKTVEALIDNAVQQLREHDRALSEDVKQLQDIVDSGTYTGDQLLERNRKEKAQDKLQEQLRDVQQLRNQAATLVKDITTLDEQRALQKGEQAKSTLANIHVKEQELKTVRKQLSDLIVSLQSANALNPTAAPVVAKSVPTPPIAIPPAPKAAAKNNTAAAEAKEAKTASTDAPVIPNSIELEAPDLETEPAPPPPPAETANVIELQEPELETEPAPPSVEAAILEAKANAAEASAQPSEPAPEPEPDLGPNTGYLIPEESEQPGAAPIEQSPEPAAQDSEELKRTQEIESAEGEDLEKLVLEAQDDPGDNQLEQDFDGLDQARASLQAAEAHLKEKLQELYKATHEATAAGDFVNSKAENDDISALKENIKDTVQEIANLKAIIQKASPPDAVQPIKIPAQPSIAETPPAPAPIVPPTPSPAPEQKNESPQAGPGEVEQKQTSNALKATLKKPWEEQMAVKQKELGAAMATAIKENPAITGPVNNKSVLLIKTELLEIAAEIATINGKEQDATKLRGQAEKNRAEIEKLKTPTPEQAASPIKEKPKLPEKKLGAPSNEKYDNLKENLINAAINERTLQAECAKISIARAAANKGKKGPKKLMSQEDAKKFDQLMLAREALQEAQHTFNSFKKIGQKPPHQDIVRLPPHDRDKKKWSPEFKALMQELSSLQNELKGYVHPAGMREMITLQIEINEFLEKARNGDERDALQHFRETANKQLESLQGSPEATAIAQRIATAADKAIEAQQNPSATPAAEEKKPDQDPDLEPNQFRIKA